MIATPAQPVTIRFTVNGEPCSAKVLPHYSLLDILRNHLGLTGTKECCLQGECGACTVLLNGRAVDSCLVFAVEADEGEVLTIEGLGSKGKLDALQTAFLESGAVQCGFCIPGMLLAAKYLLTTNPHPTKAEIQDGLAGNLCRCAGYYRFIEGVLAAAEANP